MLWGVTGTLGSEDRIHSWGHLILGGALSEAVLLSPDLLFAALVLASPGSAARNAGVITPFARAPGPGKSTSSSCSSSYVERLAGACSRFCLVLSVLDFVRLFLGSPGLWRFLLGSGELSGVDSSSLLLSCSSPDVPTPGEGVLLRFAFLELGLALDLNMLATRAFNWSISFLNATGFSLDPPGDPSGLTDDLRLRVRRPVSVRSTDSSCCSWAFSSSAFSLISAAT